MKVWIVEYDVEYEYSEIVSIHSTMQGARDAAEAFAKEVRILGGVEEFPEGDGGCLDDGGAESVTYQPYHVLDDSNAERDEQKGIMKVFTCDNFRGHWPVGTAALIVAESEIDAINQLIEECDNAGIPQDAKDIARLKVREVCIQKPTTVIIRNGEC